MSSDTTRDTILKVLEEVACNNTGSCQINLQSKSAQHMIADKLMNKLDPHIQRIIEDIICPAPLSK
jgi:hypothetical protein|tara:strand:- start:378 stop:575 length:198 start_codon:yes stop_codon:yes gene_type:complete